MPTWSYFQCTMCGRVVSYPPAPAGPRAPQCTHGHSPQTMVQVSVVKLSGYEAYECRCDDPTDPDAGDCRNCGGYHECQ